jgi:uncharacterized membrane protein
MEGEKVKIRDFRGVGRGWIVFQDTGWVGISRRYAGGRFTGGRYTGGRFTGGRFAGGRVTGRVAIVLVTLIVLLGGLGCSIIPVP